MPRKIRYQGAIVRDDHILLITHRLHEEGWTFWVIPGGGREDGETEEECVRREMLEETNLDVKVLRLLLDTPAPPKGVYRHLKTYLCEPIGGEAAPGFEPEEDAAAAYAITEVRWFDLRDPASWPPALYDDPFTYPMLQRIQEALGYKDPQG